ncbi:DUF3306 domain-containing protein [Roseibium salinum]|uniref:DUF3306 domain-containing protein n=1 Tax=Roseibium salinum TaxID=1604349 RepID=A0ABT3R903_9HYPH|nr:DUF3306 domain-containing protein [Roseibium sp. DSM 29163]MCX2725542.1 DUF3306 domain-containing protein [Roseibium sp. DSM 29163]
MSTDDEKHTDFWSRRKAAVRKAEEAERELKQEAQTAERRAELEQKSDAEILEELDLPDPDTLVKGDDFSRFLSEAVPERLRRRALRTLWRSNPVLANVDGLNDYDDDFTDAATISKVVKTVYQVGRGFLDKIGEDAAEPEGSGTAAEDQHDVSERASDASQQEDSAALQNTYDENGKTSIHLTPDDKWVQTNTADIVDSDEPAFVETEKERRSTRRRMRFDY